MQGLASELRTLSGDIEEKKLRLEKVKRDIKEASFEERLGERASKARVMEDKRDSLNAELRALSLQADARARLDLKRTEVRSRTLEIKNTCVELDDSVWGTNEWFDFQGSRFVTPSLGSWPARMRARKI